MDKAKKIFRRLTGRRSHGRSGRRRHSSTNSLPQEGEDLAGNSNGCSTENGLQSASESANGSTVCVRRNPKSGSKSRLNINKVWRRLRILQFLDVSNISSSWCYHSYYLLTRGLDQLHQTCSLLTLIPLSITFWEKAAPGLQRPFFAESSISCHS